MSSRENLPRAVGMPHHRRSVRLEGYDYGQPGAYFITVVAQARQPLFGEIADGEMHLNAAGRMARDSWMPSRSISIAA